MRIDHIALYCRDLEMMRHFFEHYFGASSNRMYHNPKTGFSSYFLSFNEGSTRLEIMSRPDVSAPSRSSCLGWAHIALAVGDHKQVDLLTKVLAVDGYQTLSGPRLTGDGYYESCVLGPEGIVIELTEG